MKTNTPERSWRASPLKRAADIGGAAVLFAVTAPVIATAAAAKWIEDRDNPFFVQRRSGRGGSTFPMFKIRTLHSGEHTGIGQGPDDQRATRLGSFLRRYGIDELPQLANILAGHMSFTGHRPAIEAEMKAIEEAHAEPQHQEAYAKWLGVLAAERPGIISTYSIVTRFAPHDERDSDSYSRERVQIDIADYEQASPLQDVKLAGQTVKLIGRVVMHNFS
ncbi:MAG TPA: sugar transferase [Candidatus Saccharimonadales bacterium]|nr:sugar transferase [Candidatus Saccharimonadales bacterium]